jgi:thioredoxin 1
MITKIEKYGATWCGPCKTLDKTLEKVKNIEIEKIDVDECDGDLLQEKGIRSVPVLIFYDGVLEIERTVGAVSLETINNIIEKWK